MLYLAAEPFYGKLGVGKRLAKATGDGTIAIFVLAATVAIIESSNVLAQGRDAALSRRVPWSDGLGGYS